MGIIFISKMQLVSTLTPEHPPSLFLYKKSFEFENKFLKRKWKNYYKFCHTQILVS